MDADLEVRAKEFAAKDPFPLQGFSHLEWWVGNAYQTAMFFRNLLGFSIVGYRGPETGVAETSSYLVESGAIRFIVTGAQVPEHPVAEHVLLHGPGVKAVAFLLPDAAASVVLPLDRGAAVADREALEGPETVGWRPGGGRMEIGCGQSGVAGVSRVSASGAAQATTVMLGSARMIAMSSTAKWVGPSGA